MDYEWSGSNAPDIDPNIVGRICEDLEKTHSITAENLVWVSQSPDSPLHGLFEWDDSIAGPRYRLSQASSILKNLRRKPLSEADSADKPLRAPDPLTVRAFYTYPGNNRRYESADAILADKHKYLRLMKKALRDLSYFSDHYRLLQEIAPILAETDKLAAQLRQIVNCEIEKLQAEDEATRLRNLSQGRALFRRQQLEAKAAKQ